MSTFNFKVNDKVANEGCGLHEFIIITAIGEGYFLGKRNTEHFGFSEEIWNKSLDWLPYTPPKKTVRMAQAKLWLKEGRAWIEETLFTLEGVRNYCKALNATILEYPLVINGVEQWHDVPVEE